MSVHARFVQPSDLTDFASTWRALMAALSSTELRPVFRFEAVRDGMHGIERVRNPFRQGPGPWRFTCQTQGADTEPAVQALFALHDRLIDFLGWEELQRTGPGVVPDSLEEAGMPPAAWLEEIDRWCHVLERQAKRILRIELERAGATEVRELSAPGSPDQELQWSKSDTRKRFAKQLGISPDTLRRRLKAGTIRAKVDSGQRIRIALADLPAESPRDAAETQQNAAQRSK